MSPPISFFLPPLDYLIRELLHPLARIDRAVKRARLSEFWLSLMRKYRHVLRQDQVEWIVKSKEEGRMKNSEIARLQEISVSRVQQLSREYRRTGAVPVLKKAGRPKSPPLTEDERREVVEAYQRFRMCACYLQMALSSQGIHINHNRIHRVLREEGISVEEPHKSKRRKWIRYEREFSNSLWHADWHQIKDERWRGQWLIAYEDDASRLITGYGVYPTLTSSYSVEVLDRAIKRYGRPKSILSDHGSTFCGVESKERERGLTEFERYLLREKVRFIMGRAYHPETNGKVEKFFDIFEKKVKFFSSIDEFMDWYDCVRPHGAFDISKLETPIKVFHDRLAEKSLLMDPDVLIREGVE
jgi:putative transposase